MVSRESGAFSGFLEYLLLLEELTFSELLPESVRFSDRWNSGRISSRRVEIQQEFEKCCEGIAARNSSAAVKTTRQACQRHGGGYMLSELR